MTVTTYFRGHPAIWVDGGWHYVDTGEAVTDDRPCARCGKPPTVEGYDACVGYVDGIDSACCGHGFDELINIKFVE